MYRSQWMKRLLVSLFAGVLCFVSLNASAELKAGVARISINPMEEDIYTQLGGYGDRAGAAATGTHDTIYGKIMVMEFDGKKSAMITLDVCHQPRCLVEETLAKAKIDGLTYANTLMAASHSHAGLEGMSMERRNQANNPHVGIFKEEVLEFVSNRLAQGLQDAVKNMQPVHAGAAVKAMPGDNRNRRNSKLPTDEDMTVVRFDLADGTPLAVWVNYTAHGTIMTANIMEVSGGWAGNMQRTVEAIMGGDVTCMYTNGAEGDVAPNNYQGGSRWEMAERYGRRIGIAAARLAQTIETKPVDQFNMVQHWVQLPEPVGAPDFLKIAGDEYQVTQEMLNMMLKVLFPKETPLYALQINDFGQMSFPGEPITAIGLAVKDQMRDAGVKFPVINCLSNDFVGYILTEEEYHKSGYEVTASFYGPGLGTLIVDNAGELAKKAFTN